MVGVRLQLPVATVPRQLTVPSLTVTLPVGVPPVEVTLKFTTTAWPVTDGFGRFEVIAVVLVAMFTV